MGKGVVFLLLLLGPISGLAAEFSPLPSGPFREEWSLAFENDILAGGSRDKDFTYGMSLIKTGKNTAKSRYSPLKVQGKLDSWLKLDERPGMLFTHSSFELGLYGFTPEDISLEQVNREDRPYASLVYVASAKERVNPLEQSVVSSSLSLGALGLSWVGDLQNGLHEMVDGKQAQGWKQQISQGGELTMKYSLAKQSYLPTRFTSLELKATRQISLGYISEASYSWGLRAGKLRSPWWLFKPELTVYGEKPVPVITKSGDEKFVWAGVSIKARFYNAFLQGQFRSSPHRYKARELNPVLLEAWAGYTFSISEVFSLSYLLRAQSSEIKQGNGDRNLVWGGLVFSRELI